MGRLASFAAIAVMVFGIAPGGIGAQDDSRVYYFNPAWSPDGSNIVFESGLDGELSIYSIGGHGENLTRLTDGEYNDEGPVWSPDGTKIAFFSNRREGRDERPVSLQIYIMNADGTGQERLTDEGSALDYNPSWSPDGTRLVFQSRPEISPNVNSLYVVGADGSGRRRVTDARYSDESPRWSPDADVILYRRSTALRRFNRDLTRGDRAQARASAEIVLLDLGERTSTPITQNDLPDNDPSWDADGSEIYFLRDDGPDKRTFFRQVMGEAVAVAVAVADGHVVSNPGPVTRTRLSPNGRLLAYHKEVDGVFGLYIYDLALKEEIRLIGGSVG